MEYIFTNKCSVCEAELDADPVNFMRIKCDCGGYVNSTVYQKIDDPEKDYVILEMN